MQTWPISIRQRMVRAAVSQITAWHRCPSGLEPGVIAHNRSVVGSPTASATTKST